MEIRIEQGKKEEREKIRVIKRNGTKQGGRKSKSNAIINQKKKGGKKWGKRKGMESIGRELFQWRSAMFLR